MTDANTPTNDFIVRFYKVGNIGMGEFYTFVSAHTRHTLQTDMNIGEFDEILQAIVNVMAERSSKAQNVTWTPGDFPYRITGVANFQPSSLGYQMFRVEVDLTPLLIQGELEREEVHA